MKRTIYVAGGSDERHECQAAIDRLKENGWKVTHEWPKDKGYPENGGEAQGMASALCDLVGVEIGRYTWLRVPSLKTEGGFAELGYAIALKKMQDVCRYKIGQCENHKNVQRCIIVSGPWQRSIFCELADLKFDTHEQAMTWLLEMAP